MTGKLCVAIACQGGGSHAAFVAGLLGELLSRKHRELFDVVAISGTSGGAMCAALTWAGLITSGADDAMARLEGFWRELEVHDLYDAMINFWGVALARLPVTEEVSPYLFDSGAADRLHALLQKHLRLPELTDAVRAKRPALRIGATEILTGDRTVFEGATITYEKLIASAAIPPLFKSIEIDQHRYWDGLFATNPPIRELIELFPKSTVEKPLRKELWVIQVNPQRRENEPRTMRDITDRRNELAGNLSLGQELYFIDKINELLLAHPTLAKRYDPIKIRVVEMGLKNLDYPSKLDRDPELIDELMHHGAHRAAWFFDDRSLWPRDKTVPRKAVKR